MRELLAAVIALAALAGCTKTAEWQEEVPLNTGETVWVTRTVEFERYGDNPLALGWSDLRSREEVLQFDWRGTRYRIQPPRPPLVLFIDPVAGQPALVLPQLWHNCRRPHFEQWQAGPGGWTPRPLSPAAVGLPKNLMRDRPARVEQIRSTYPAALIRELDAPSSRHFRDSVDPDYLPPACAPRR